MVVMDEVTVIVVVAVPVLAMPIVAVPIVTVPIVRAAMPATTAPSANTGDVSAKRVVPSADFVASLTLKRGRSLRWIASRQSKDGVQPLIGSNSTSLSCRLLSRLPEVWGQGWPRQPQLF